MNVAEEPHSLSIDILMGIPHTWHNRAIREIMNIACEIEHFIVEKVKDHSGFVPIYDRRI